MLSCCVQAIHHTHEHLAHVNVRVAGTRSHGVPEQFYRVMAWRQ